MEKIVDRFLRYVAFDTTSNPDSQSQPSTNKQFALLEQLRKELVAMGLENVELDKYGYLMASIPSNIEEDVPAIGFISHVLSKIMTARPSLSTRLKAWFSTRRNSPS